MTISLINELPTQHRMLVVGDFNLCQMLPEHVAKLDPLFKNLNLSQRLQYSTHIHGEYWIWYLILQILIPFFLCCHPSVITLLFFSKSDALYLYRI